MRVKVTWSGEGQPEGGVLEYGYGTDHPKIPQGITRQKDDPDSNWTFEYVGQDTSSLKMHKYLSQPVWFYAKEGEEFYTVHRNLIPDDAEAVREGTYSDVYRIAATETRSPSAKSPLEELDNSTYAREKKLMETLARTTIAVKPDRRGLANGFSIVPDADGGYSLLSLYLFAAKTGNQTLVSQLNGWAGKKSALHFMTADLFSGDRAVADLVRESPALPIVQTITGSRTWKELNANIAKIYASIQSKVDGFEEDSVIPMPAPKSAPARAIPEELVQPDIVPPTPAPPPTPQEVMESKIEFIPERYEEIGVGSTDFSKKYAAKEIDSGLQYIKNIPDMILSEVFLGLSEPTKRVFSTYLSGFIKKEDGTRYRLVPKAGRNFRPSQPLSKSAVTDELMVALAEFESALNKRNPEFEIGNVPTDYSPLLTMDFPYMWALGRESEKVFAALQGAYFVSLKNKMMEYDQKTGSARHEDILENLDGAWGASIQLTAVEGSVVLGAMDDIWSYKTYKEGDKEMLSPLGAAIAEISEKTGLPPERVQTEMMFRLRKNLENLALLKNTRATSQGVVGNRSMSVAGRAMGLTVSAHTNGLKNRPPTDKENSLMHVAQGQLGTVLEEIFGERVEVSLGDTLTYYPSTPGMESISFSLGLLQYQHNYMPYYISSEGDVIIEVAGDEHNLSKLEGRERAKVLDAFMERVGTLCNSGKSDSIDAQSAIYSVLQKYQHGLYTEFPEEAAAVLGGRKVIEKVPQVEDIHNDSEYLQKSTRVFSSISNFIATDAEKWLKGGIPENLTPEEVSSLNGEPHRLVELAFQRKIDAISLDIPSILDELEIPGNHRMMVTDMIMDALSATKESARKKMEARGAKGKGTLDSSQLGSIMEHTQVLVPALSALRNASKLGKSVEIVPGTTGRGVYHTGLTPEMLAGRDAMSPATSRTQSAFLRNRFTSGGFHLKIDGVDNYFVKEDRTGGFGDIVHISDPKGEAAVYPFEGKLGKGTKLLKPHLSQVSPMMRFVLSATASSKKLKVGRTGTVYLHYGEAESAATPTGQLRQAKNSSMYFIPKFGIAKQGSATIDYDRMSKLFSASDGAALECVNYG